MVDVGEELTIRVLVVDDEEELRAMLLALLADGGFDVHAAHDGAQALELCAAEDFDVIVLDLSMPHIDGRMVLSELRGGGVLESTKVIVVTAHHAPATVVELLEAGATDFVNKPFDPAELEARVTVAGRAARHLRNLRVRNSQLHHRANTDSLTGLPNRAALEAFLEHALLTVPGPVGVAMLDINAFKSVNDAHGHGIGDAALIHIAGLVGRSVRTGDVVGRWGGDELLLVCPAADLQQIAAAAVRLQRAVAGRDFPVGGTALPLSLSAGWASGTGPPEVLVAAADEMLYRNKSRGPSSHSGT